MQIEFIKMQALGNDFVLVDCRSHDIRLKQQHIKLLADRKRGIGFDQLLIIENTWRKDVDYTYRIINADGSEVGQCGNGARCVGYYLWHRNNQVKTSFKLGTEETVLHVDVDSLGKVKVNMGVPKFIPEDIPFITREEAPSYFINYEGVDFEFRVVNVGNPHCLITVDDIQEAPVQQLGPYLMQHECFPEQVNVGFVEYDSPQHICLRVFERGVGETLACGSGACAAVAIGQREGRLVDEVIVTLPGGDLQVMSSKNDPAIWLQGPATIVFEGTMDVKS